MPFSRPTLQQLVDAAEADFDTRLPGADARLRNSNLNVLARIHAGGLHGLYGYLDWIALQAMVDTAELEHLERHASIWGITRKAATAATGTATLTGTNGTIVPIGTALRRGDGAEYELTAQAVIAAGTAAAAIRAKLAGAAGNAATAVKLNFVSPIAGINGEATVAAPGLSGGVDQESDTLLRGRVLRRIQEPPHGGASADYVTWALEVPGVTRAWAYPLELGVGTVVVRFVMDDKVGTIIPDAGEVATVQAYIDARRPVTATVTVVAPIAKPLNRTIQLTPNNVTVQAAVDAEIADMLRREAAPGVTILRSHLTEAISVAAGESDHVLSVPAGNFACATGEIATNGVTTWL